MSGGGEGRKRGKGRIIHWDGSVEEFEKGMTVAEVMMEHPQQVVVEFQCAVTHRRPSPLPADNNLDLNTLYLMLPLKPGKPLALNAHDTRRFLSILNSVLLRSKTTSSSRVLPWMCQVVKVHALLKKEQQNHNHEDSHSNIVLLPQTESESEPTTTLEEVDDNEVIMQGRTPPEYLNLNRQFSGKAWKPSLDTINENTHSHILRRSLSNRLFHLNPF